MAIINPTIKLKSIEQIWKDSTDILTSSEISIIHKSLKNMSSEIKEIRESKKTLSYSEIIDIEKKFGNLINYFVRNFDFNRIIDSSQRRSIAKYSYHILICIINIIDKSGSDINKEDLFKSCQICLNYYFPSKAVKDLENKIIRFDLDYKINLNKFENKIIDDHYIKTPPRNTSRLESEYSLPNPSPFQTIWKSPRNSINSTSYNAITRYNSSENCLAEYSFNQNFKNDDIFFSDSDFLPKEFQLPLSIEETKKKLKEKLLKKEISEIKKLNKNPDIKINDDHFNSFNKNKSLMQSWGSESDKSDLQIEDLMSSNTSNYINKKLDKQRIQIDDFWESTKVAAELAETLSEPYRTRRIRNEIYQQSIEKSVTLLKSLGICPNLRSNVLLKTMFHTVEQIIDYN